MTDTQKRGRGRPAIDGPLITFRLEQDIADAVDAAAALAGQPRAAWLRDTLAAATTPRKHGRRAYHLATVTLDGRTWQALGEGSADAAQALLDAYRDHAAEAGGDRLAMADAIDEGLVTVVEIRSGEAVVDGAAVS